MTICTKCIHSGLCPMIGNDVRICDIYEKKKPCDYNYLVIDGKREIGFDDYIMARSYCRRYKLDKLYRMIDGSDGERKRILIDAEVWRYGNSVSPDPVDRDQRRCDDH